MRFSTPAKFQKFFYFGVDTSAVANIGDELLGFGIGSLYLGIYPLRRGYDVSVGIVDANGCLN